MFDDDALKISVIFKLDPPELYIEALIQMLPAKS